MTTTRRVWVATLALAEGAAPVASLAGMGTKTSIALAALVNGTGGHAFELDDIHKESIVHAGSIATPIAFAFAEQQGGAPGKDIVTAMIAGYEVGHRVGSAATMSLFFRGFHPQGTSGTFVAAATAARALGLDAAAIQSGLRSFPGLAHRMEQVGRKGAVLFVNDSKATNGDAASKALACYDSIYWIAGGLAKKGGIAGLAGVALSQIDNVSPNLGQGYIIDSFMVVVFGGVGNLFGTLVGAFSLGIVNKFLEPYAGAVLGKILVLVFIILFIQRRPRGLFALKGRSVE